MVAHLSQCQCRQAIEDLGTHLFWCPCGVNIQQPMIHSEILLPWKVEHMFRGRSPTFSFVTPNVKWISLSPETTFGP